MVWQEAGLVAYKQVTYDHMEYLPSHFRQLHQSIDSASGIACIRKHALIFLTLWRYISQYLHSTMHYTGEYT